MTYIPKQQKITKQLDLYTIKFDEHITPKEEGVIVTITMGEKKIRQKFLFPHGYTLKGTKDLIVRGTVTLVKKDKAEEGGRNYQKKGRVW